jgi:hypothetical protein
LFKICSLVSLFTAMFLITSLAGPGLLLLVEAGIREAARRPALGVIVCELVPAGEGQVGWAGSVLTYNLIMCLP